MGKSMEKYEIGFFKNLCRNERICTIFQKIRLIKLAFGVNFVVLLYCKMHDDPCSKVFEIHFTKK